MRRTSFDSWPCSIARTVDLIGDAWTVLVIRELFYRQTKFDGFVDALRVPRTTLTDRLTQLVARGVVERRQYQTDPVRHEYVLTAQGRDLFGVLAAMNAWGDRWLAGDDGVPIVLRHEPCGHELQTQTTCTACGHVVTADQVSSHTGPGYPVNLIHRSAVVARFAPKPQLHGDGSPQSPREARR